MAVRGVEESQTLIECEAAGKEHTKDKRVAVEEAAL